MKNLLYILSVAVLIAGCKKDEPTESKPIATKWALIPGDYKVYDTLGTFLYNMHINYFTQPDINGGFIKFFRFAPFGEFGHVAVYQNTESDYTNEIYFGELNGIHDQQGYKWVVTDLGSFAYNIFTNDTIEINFEKDNGPYWEADNTTYQHEVVRQYAVRQH